MTELDKGAPHSGAALGKSVVREELSLPACTVRSDALRANSTAMLDFLARVGRDLGADIALCPHGKTTMSPDLFRRQLTDGCWGITVATPHQVRVARHFGIPRILLANELVGRRDIDWIVAELERDPGFEFFCLVDSVDAVHRLAERADRASLDRPVDVLLEAGYGGGRCGVRSIDDGLAVARAVHARRPVLRLVGLETFEGLLQTRPAAEGDARVAALIGFVAELAAACDAEGLLADASPVLLSAGGSSFYDLAARILATAAISRPVKIVVRSGCYLIHDVELYGPLLARLRQRDPLAHRERLAFTPALEVWAHVLSVPEPSRLVLGAGRRDFGEDAGPPVLTRHFRDGTELPAPRHSGADLAAVNDQHGIVDFTPPWDVRVGDILVLTPAHPCTTFDKWRTVHVIDDQATVIETLNTYF
ncbi:alanine racemase [Mycobacterium sp. 1081908.1]|uniref:alanine racemase n=1 Tax=Mycobacterium sp. 1081908.1 TaxID=1834066 RepID=UPI0009ED55F7|nr:alanine racemase [Mycobacterium sp. 1081908.1]